MDIELRLLNTKDIDFALELDVDCISVGDEGCPYRIPFKNELYSLVNRIFSAGIKPKLVTPRVAQRDFNIIENAIDLLIDFGIDMDIVVNDLGVLQLCREKKAGLRIFLGRLIARSISDCPWGEYSLRNEKESIREILQGHSFNDDEKIELMKQLNIKGIEVNSAKNIESSLMSISSKEILVNVHFGNKLLTVGRDCITARHFKLKPIECKEECCTKLKIEWDGLWLSPTLNNEAVDDLHKQMLKDAFVLGNRVFVPCSSTEEGLRHKNINSLILDSDSNFNDLDARISRIKEVFEE